MTKKRVKTDDKFNPGLKEGMVVYGYEIIRKLKIEEIAAWYYQLRHKKTGARHVHISRDDQENTFSVAFKTVPKDSTGVAHILEHTVLAGSKKYPIRDPFFTMLKRTLSTFMNAFTSSDWTMYPFSSTNERDFNNLLSIYLDAAFFPKIDNLSFMQEGIRLETEINEKTGLKELVYKGVVFNEMKGAMSSPDQVMERSLMNALLPGSTYANNSGGEPEDIPVLTHKMLKDFHSLHYHPSNAYFYTYGNLPLTDRLEIIEKNVLINFKKIDPKTNVPRQKRWTAPKELTYPYAIDGSENLEKKYQVCVAWLTSDITDTYEVLIQKILEEYLLGNNASPLRLKLIESGMGSDLSDSAGLEFDIRDNFFTAGLKDVKKGDRKKIEKLIFSELEKIIKNGTDEKLVESAIHQIKFRVKEITNTPYPYGIKLFLKISGMWMHGGYPVNALKLDADFEKLQNELDKNPNYLAEKIKEYFIDNMHRVLFTLEPDSKLQELKEAAEKDKLAAILKNKNQEEITKIEKTAQELKDLQGAEEDLSCLPTLPRSEVQPTVIGYAPNYKKNPISTYIQSTGGIEYFTAAIGTGHLPTKLLSLVPFFCYAYDLMGTDVRDNVSLSQTISRYTGGISLGAKSHIMYNAKRECLPVIFFSGKCLSQNRTAMYELIEELMFKANFTNLNYLSILLNQFRAAYEDSIVKSGHRRVLSLASRNFSIACALNESWGGVHQLLYLKNLTKNLDEKKLGLIANDLDLIKRHIFTQNNIKLAIIGENPNKKMCNFISRLPRNKEHGFCRPDMHIQDEVTRDGYMTSTAVSFTAQLFPVIRYGHKDAPALTVISKIMRGEYIHRKIREDGGAYGGYSIYDSENGLFGYASFRDPHIVNTLNVFNRAAEFIKSGKFTEEMITESVLSICSEIDKPDPPGPGARKAFVRSLLGLTDAMRNKNKNQLLNLSKSDIMRVANKYFNNSTKNSVAVISYEEKLKKANENLENPLKLHKI